MTIHVNTVSTSPKHMNHFAPPNSPSTEGYQHYQQSFETPVNAGMVQARIKELETQHHHRFAHSRMEQPYAYPIHDIPETPRNHTRHGGHRTPLRLAAQHQTSNSTTFASNPECVEMARTLARENRARQTSNPTWTTHTAPTRPVHQIPPATHIQSVWTHSQAQQPWNQGSPLGSPPAGYPLMPHGTPSMGDHNSYSTPYRPSRAYNAPPASAVPIPYEFFNPSAEALPPPPPGFEHSPLGSANSSPRQSLQSYRSRADSEGSHYDSALSTHSPCSVHRDDESFRLSTTDGNAGPSSPALSTSSLYTAYSCMYCLNSDDNGYTNHLAPDSTSSYSPTSTHSKYDDDGYLLRPKEPSSPGFSFPSSSPFSNSSPQGLCCSSDEDGPVVEPENGPGPIRRPGSVEDQTSAFWKKRQERLARLSEESTEEEKIESIKFMLEAELLSD